MKNQVTTQKIKPCHLAAFLVSVFSVTIQAETIASLFFAKDSFGIHASESAKNHATSFIACGSPDSSFVQSLISHTAAA